MRCKPFALAALMGVAIFSSSLSASAEGAKRLPEPIYGYIVLHSFERALDEIDKALSAATKGRQTGYIPGMLPVMAQMVNPLPPAAWKADGEVYLLIDTNRGRARDVKIVFGHFGFERLVKELTAARATFEVMAEGRLRVRLRTGPDLFLADIGDGRMLGAAKEEDLDRFAGPVAAWRSDHEARGTLAVYMDMKTVLDVSDAPFKRMLDELENMDLDEYAAELEKDGTRDKEMRDALVGTRRLLKRHAPAMLAEFESIGLFGIGVDLKPEHAVLSYFFRPGEGTYLQRLAAHLSERGPQLETAAKTIGAESFGFLLLPSLRDVVPDVAEVRAALSAFFDEVRPHKKEEPLDFFDRWLSAGMGGTVVGGRYDDNVFHLAAFTPVDNTDIVDGLLEELGFAAGKTTDGGIPYHAIELDIWKDGDSADAAESTRDFGRAVNGLFGDVSELAAVRTDEILALVFDRDAAGAIGRAAAAASGVENSIMNLAGVAAAVDALKCDQAGMLLLSADLCADLTLGYMGASGMVDEAILKRMRLAAEWQSGDVAALGIGASGGTLALELFVPMSCVNRVVSTVMAYRQGGK